MTIARQPFGHIVIEPKPEHHGSFWIDAPREGFTTFCSEVMAVPIPVDDVTDREAQVLQRRADLLATLVGLQQARQNGAIRRANVVNEN